MGLSYFRVYAEPGSSLYFRAFVWDTKREMLEFNRKTGKSLDQRTQAVFRGAYRLRIRGDGRQIKTPYCGDVHFYKRCLGVGFISHEWLHAALDWARRRRLNFREISTLLENSAFVSDDEERLCYAYDFMVRQFVNRCYERGIY